MSPRKQFTIKEEHLKLLRRLQIDEVDFRIDQKRPFGNSDVYKDVVDILEWKVNYDENSQMGVEWVERVDKILKELCTALEIIVQSLGDHHDYVGKWKYHQKDSKWYKVI